MDSLLLKRQQESAGQRQAAKASRLLVEQQQQQPPASVLALFVHEPDNSNSSKFTITGPSSGSNILSIIPSSASTGYPRPGSLFSLSQWRELELQALIYKYIVAGASVPLELILPIRRGLLNATPYYQLYQHFHLAMMPTSYLGGSTSDPEPGRCKRTDGKKWRCSREVVAGHKYCERHMHRGRSRSRKHVEVPAQTTFAGSAPFSPSPLAGAGLPSPLHVLPLNRRHPGGSDANESLPQTYCRSYAAEKLGDGRPGSRTLRHFFDDWSSEQQQQPNNANGSSTVGPPTSTAKLSISVPEQPPKSDISLKLCTGSSEKRSPHGEAAPGDAAVQPIRASSWSGWAGQPAASVGGPLAEALRSSSSTPSPTSVLLKPNASASETTSSLST